MSARSIDIRKPAVAGMFYPADPAELRRDVDQMLASAAARSAVVPPKAVIAPHAGYAYSGPVAATAYSSLPEAAGRIRRVVLLGPAHRVYVDGVAATTARFYRTPLGDVPVDQAALASILDLPQVRIFDEAHLPEHSLEVQLPFLQRTLVNFAIVPLVVGEASADEVAEVLERLWGGDETLIVVSSDLSHYHPYDEARRLDERTASMVTGLRVAGLEPDLACGSHPIRGLLSAAPRHRLRGVAVDLRNSGDTAGSKDRVVGYGSFLFYEPPAA